ncbi:MAG: hypothetical protein EOP10_00625 [Proteobacteria bacterium]|nr:MAG: hypothetical protein EOP10_00625 [Pseudomonadota bacterium]
MKSRYNFLKSLTWLLSAAALIWTLWILNSESRYHRTSGLSQTAEGLLHLATLLPSDSKEQKAVEQASKNIDGLSDGAVLLEERALHIAAFFMLLAVGFSTLSLVSSLLHTNAETTVAVSLAVDHDQNFEFMLSQTLEDLGRIQAKVEAIESARSPGSTQRTDLDRDASDIVALESHLVFIKSQTELLSEQNQKALDNLRGLTSQADDFANFSSASRLEWNALSVKLAQFKEAHSSVRVKTEMILKTQNANQELLTKSLDFHKTHSGHSQRAADDVDRMYKESKSTTDLFVQLIAAMAESSSNVDLSNKLVRGLSERAEEIVNIIDVIDDIAEQTNQLALNASIEAARAGEQGKGFAVVAGEVRSLAARSSTATRTITELLETIQIEANQASICLEKTNSSVGTAHSRIQDVEVRCRETMVLSHKVGGELADIISATNEHGIDVQTIDKQCAEVSRMTQKLLRSLDDLDQMNALVHQESNQLAVHTDRISRLMSRHYFAVQYAERMSSGQTEGLRGLMDQSTQVLSRSQSLRASWDEKYRSVMTARPLAEGKHANTSSELGRLVSYCQSNLELLRSRTPTLSISSGDGGEDDINLVSDAPLTSDDDGDITMEKAS